MRMALNCMISTINSCHMRKKSASILKNFPSSSDILNECKPVYEVMAGWQKPTSGITRFDKLPGNAQIYIKRLEELTGTSIIMVSVGAGRKEAITMENPFL